MTTREHSRDGYNVGGTMSDEYETIRDHWAMSQDGDEYGTLMMWYFAAAETLYAATGECVPTFSPGMATRDLDDLSGDGWEYGVMVDLYRQSGDAALEAMRDWCAWCHDEHQILEQEGKAY